MLEKLNNPSGLFYTLHGRPELYLPTFADINHSVPSNEQEGMRQ